MNTLDIIKEMLGIGEFSFDRTLGGLRSNQWPTVRKQYLSLHPDCEACGRKKELLKPLQVHHCEPFHLRPELELKISNLITLCDDCHILLGHLRSFKSFNKDIRDDAARLLAKIASRP